jgi:hypothetical protein
MITWQRPNAGATGELSLLPGRETVEHARGKPESDEEAKALIAVEASSAIHAEGAPDRART